ncbi:MAG: hypothetical protein GY849_18430 [Deltaproteobacteria bacterium]|nr:hypothetical protein [Deltaproteobacteria bacterium]
MHRKRQFLGIKNRKITIQDSKRECEDGEIDMRALKGGSRRGKISKVRAYLIEKLVDDFGFSLAEAGRQIGVSSSAVAKAISRRDNKES